MPIRRSFSLRVSAHPVQLLVLLGGGVLCGAPLLAACECLSAMATPADWAPCATGASPCWAFVALPPFVYVGPAPSAAAVAARRRLFPCALAGEYGFGGDGFVLLSVLGDGVGVDTPHWCVYAGSPEECTFDGLVAYVNASGTRDAHPAFGAALGLLASLLSTPERADMGVWLQTLYRVGGRGGGTRWQGGRRVLIRGGGGGVGVT